MNGVTNTTIYNWKAKYGGLTVSEARRLKILEDENGKLKRIVADLTLDNQALKASSQKTSKAQGKARGLYVYHRELWAIRKKSLFCHWHMENEFRLHAEGKESR